MSQKVQIKKVKITGAKIFLGTDQYGNPLYSRNPDKVMNWLADGYRSMYNLCRALRPAKTVKHEAEDGTITYETTQLMGKDLPLEEGAKAGKLKVSEMKEGRPWLASIPACVSGVPYYENKDWIAALRARKTNFAKGEYGELPGFKSRKKSDQTFLIKIIPSGNSGKFTKTGKKSGFFYIGGINSAPYTQSGKKRESWLIRVYIRTNQEIHDFTSIRVNWTKKEAVFVNQPQPLKVNENRNAIGIDRGVAKTVTLSNGESFSTTRLTEAEKKRFLTLERKLARQEKGSKAREETKRLLNVLRKKSANRAETFEHQLSAHLVKNFDTIVLENLQTSKMTKSAKGTIENPGKNVRQKAGLNRAILENRWYALEEKIKYKQNLTEGKVVMVDPKHTSQMCSQCGHTAKENRKSQAKFHCQNCGHTMNADHNAAINILNKGTKK